MGNDKEVVHDFLFIGRVLEILKILQEETDEYTTISQTKILELMKEHEYPCSERTLTDYLKVLMKELNPEEYDGFVDEKYSIDDYRIIVKVLKEKLEARDNGLEKEGSEKLAVRSLSYNHLFSFNELNHMIEAILFMKNMDDEMKELLVRKLQTLSSVRFPKYSPYISETTGKISNSISAVFEDSRIDEATVRENLRLIQEAIEADGGRGTKIAFHFNGYNEKKELVPRKTENGKLMTYIVNPYYVILYDGKYYLVCNKDNHDDIAFYRIDLMSDVTSKTKTSVMNKKKTVSEMRKPKREVNGIPLEWNSNSASQFQSEHMYMFYGDACKIRIKIKNTRYTLLHDFFGNRYTFLQHIDEQWDEVEVKCVPSAMESWALQCSKYVEVLEPVELRNSIKERCRQLMERYT